ncbi:MAG: esterase family protein [Clostridiales bacterium]|nr:esterase family protein [Clostridiales bacterium]
MVRKMAQLTCNFLSYSLRRAVSVSVILPTPTPSEVFEQNRLHRPADKYPVLYLLHGHGNDHTTWMRYTSLERYAEESNLAVVTFATENKFYVNHNNQDLFYDFIEKELPDFVLGLFPISPRREDTYIAGLSMGGFGALYHALNNPARFRAFGAFSAGMRHTGFLPEADAVIGEERPDLFLLLDRVAGDIADMPAGYMSCGTEDGLFALNDEFQKKYIGLGGQLEWRAVADYAHEWRFWDREIQEFLAWIPRTDAYVGGRVRRV